MNNIEFDSEETKKAYEELKSKIKEYNEKVKCGQSTDIDPFDLLDKFKQKYKVIDLEPNDKKTSTNNELPKSKIDIDKLIEDIDKKLAEIEGE